MCGLSRPGLIAGVIGTKSGQLRVNIWNSTEGAIQLTPKTVLVNIMGAEIWVRHFGKKPKMVSSTLAGSITGEDIKKKIMSTYPKSVIFPRIL